MSIQHIGDLETVDTLSLTDNVILNNNNRAMIMSVSNFMDIMINTGTAVLPNGNSILDEINYLYDAIQHSENPAPTFTKTTLCDNSALSTGALTLSGAYDNYDFLMFEIWNTNYSRSTKILTTPEIIADIIAYSGSRVNFNELGNNQYCTYTFSSKTALSRSGSRNCVLKTIEGWNPSNCTVTKTDLYRKQAITDETVSITSQVSLYSYDYIALSACDGDSTETQPCAYLAKAVDRGDIGAFMIPNKFNPYNVSSDLVFTEYTMNAQKYFRVQGIKFQFQ